MPRATRSRTNKAIAAATRARNSSSSASYPSSKSSSSDVDDSGTAAAAITEETVSLSLGGRESEKVTASATSLEGLMPQPSSPSIHQDPSRSSRSPSTSSQLTDRLLRSNIPTKRKEGIPTSFSDDLDDIKIRKKSDKTRNVVGLSIQTSKQCPPRHSSPSNVDDQENIVNRHGHTIEILLGSTKRQPLAEIILTPSGKHAWKGKEKEYMSPLQSKRLYSRRQSTPCTTPTTTKIPRELVTSPQLSPLSRRNTQELLSSAISKITGESLVLADPSYAIKDDMTLDFHSIGFATPSTIYDIKPDGYSSQLNSASKQLSFDTNLVVVPPQQDFFRRPQSTPFGPPEQEVDDDDDIFGFEKAEQRAKQIRATADKSQDLSGTTTSQSLGLAKPTRKQRNDDVESSPSRTPSSLSEESVLAPGQLEPEDIGGLSARLIAKDKENQRTKSKTLKRLQSKPPAATKNSARGSKAKRSR